MYHLSGMPIGYLISVLLLAWCAWWALLPRHTPAIFASLSFYSGFLVNELPFLALVGIVAATLLALHEGDIRSPGGWATLGLAILTMIGLLVIACREARAIPVLRKALDDGLGEAWHDTIGGNLAAKFRPSFRLAALLGPFFRRRWDVELVSNISYGGAGKRNLLDVFRHRSRPCDAPVLIHFHGGAMIKGKKNREALPLLYRLASQGWVCISANYRLEPAARYPDQLIDAKKVIAWVRVHGGEYGADTSAVFVAGGSAGAQLAAHSALTPNDPELQPGFESADTSVSAAITLYGYYRWIQRGSLKQLREVASGGNDDPCLQACSTSHIQAEIPPFFVVHGEQDTVIPVEDARYFVDILRSVSRSPIVYAELPGAQHTFDLFIPFVTKLSSMEYNRLQPGCEQGKDCLLFSGKSTKPEMDPLRAESGVHGISESDSAVFSVVKNTRPTLP